MTRDSRPIVDAVRAMHQEQDGRDPYNSWPRVVDRRRREIVTNTPEQHETADRLLAGSSLSMESSK